MALAIILALGLIFNADGAFFKWDTHRDMLRHIARYGILACGMTIVILGGGIDLAVGSILGLTAVVSALLMIHMQYSPWIAVPICLFLGMACGAASGSVIARFNVQPFIATLAMMVFARGFGQNTSAMARRSRRA
ncbi:MAG: ABC transporter permease [Candidatus Competibacteraceae bacterium]|nr:ABC transporter permease [Candidatus Competibacteraceae bacterium]